MLRNILSFEIPFKGFYFIRLLDNIVNKKAKKPHLALRQKSNDLIFFLLKIPVLPQMS